MTTIKEKAASLRNKDFLRERNLRDHIIKNLDQFCVEFLEDKMVSCHVEKAHCSMKFGSARLRRPDMRIECEKKNYIIELKNPSHPRENTAAIGQLLDYGRQFPNPKNELVLITTMFCRDTALTIKYWKLPIRYIYMDSNRSLEWIEEDAA